VNEQQQTHRDIARLIAAEQRTCFNEPSLVERITTVLDRVREDERVFWKQALASAALLCEQQGEYKAAHIIRLVLDSTEKAEHP
jgi:hypothetical protein